MSALVEGNNPQVIVRALYDYKARTPEELSMVQNEELELISNLESSCALCLCFCLCRTAALSNWLTIDLILYHTVLRVFVNVNGAG